MKKVLSVILTAILLLTILPVSTLPTAAENAEQAEPAFTVEVTGNTFKIKRKDNTTRQKVAYRTVSVTAVEGIHFTPATGGVTFEVGDSYKTVTVTEAAVADIPIRYRYQSGTYREYRFEVIDDFGFLLASASRRIDYGNDYVFDNYRINSSVVDLVPAEGSSGTSWGGYVPYTLPNNARIEVTDAGYSQAVHSVSVADFYDSIYGLAPKEYLSAIGDKLYTAAKFSVSEKNDGYQYIQILADNTSTYDGDDPDGNVNTPSISYYKACFERDVGSDANTESSYMNFPHRYDYQTRAEELAAGVRPQFLRDENKMYAQQFRNDTVKAANAGAVMLDPMVETVNFRFDAAGYKDDTWYISDMRVYFALGDEFPPTLVDQVYVSRSSAYTRHSPVTITLCFNEIVSPANHCTLKTTWGDLTVIDTVSYGNVLSFTGPITATPGTTLKITGIEGTVKDLFGRAMTTTLSKSLGYTVGQNQSLTLANGAYLISSVGELYAYADMLESYPNRPGRLTADIDMTNSERCGFTAMAGAGFTGTFEGDGHKIYNLQNVSGTTNGMCGLFGYVSAGGRVQNLDLEISFTAPLGNSGAICGLNLGTVENCTVTGKIRNSFANAAQSTTANRFGGVVGDNGGNVIHCLALNGLTNNWQALTVGGIVGYNSGTVESCCFYGTFDSNNAVTRGAIAGENAASGTVINCAARNLNTNYYSYAIGTNNGTATNTHYVSANLFYSGQVCYEVLNNGVSDGTQFWHQNLDNGQPHDDYPQFTGGTVYKHNNAYTNSVGHVLSHVGAVAATCETAGHAEYWVCTLNGCGKVFADANCQQETTLDALTIPAFGHDWPTDYNTNAQQHWLTCSRCGATTDAQIHDYTGQASWYTHDVISAELTLTCSVCGAQYQFPATVTYSDTGTHYLATATTEVNDTTYTDERAFSKLIIGENAAPITIHAYTSYFFVPSATGRYHFYSTSVGFDPKIYVYDLSGNLLGTAEDISNTNCNFDLWVDLEAGQPYHIKIYSWNSTDDLTMFVYLQYDLNNDGVADADDYDFLVSAALGDVPTTDSLLTTADLNNDGMIDALDCRLFKLALQGKDLPT